MKTRSFVLMALIFGMAFSVSAQDLATEAKYGADSVNCVTKLSTYREYFKQWEAAKFAPDALSPEMVAAWREVWMTGPRSSEYIYSNGQKILDYYIRNTKDKDVRNAYIDSLMLLHDTRVAAFPTKKTGESQVASILGRKGHDMYSYNPARYEEAYNILKQAVELDANQIQVGFLDTYFRAVVDMANNEKIEKMEVINVYQQLSDVIDANLKNFVEQGNEKQINNYKGVKNNIDGAFQPFASCEDLVNVFTAKMAENPDDIDLLKRITTILDKKDCTDQKLFLDASKKLYELEPTPESAYNIGIKLFKEGKNGEAARYFEEATSAENIDRVYRAYRNLAYCYLNVGNYSRSREAARKASSVDPTAGEPYIIIAMAYASSAGSLEGSKFDGKEVFWAAVDKLSKAASLDASVADRANDLIRSYRQHFPSTETIFFNDYAEGASFTVGGWINESTTIRAAK